MKASTLVLALILISAAGRLQGRRYNGYGNHRISVVCGSGQELCGNECYTPSTQTCFQHKNGWGKKPCLKNETLCDWDCVRPVEKICIDQEGRFEVLCNPGEAACSRRCYSPETQSCLDNDFLCSKDEAVCAGSCYSISGNKTCIEGRYGSKLCDRGQEVCGSWGCYSRDKKKCFDTKDVLCDAGEEICGYNKCYNPATGDTCHNGKIVCKSGEELCGSDCFSNTKGQVCLENKKVCKSGESLCGDSRCYNPSAGEQCIEARPDYHVVCGKCLNYCWYNCYNPETDTCLEADGDPYKMVCAKGNEICLGILSPSTRGYGCFNPNEKVCLRFILWRRRFEYSNGMIVNKTKLLSVLKTIKPGLWTFAG